MGDIEILHLSDLHWSEDKQVDMQIVIDALLVDIRRMKLDGKIDPDIVVFSGDLANSGEDEYQFNSAYQKFLVPVLSELNIAKGNLFIVPGNHDISRQNVRSNKFIENGLLSTLTSVDVLNSFIDDLNKPNASQLHALDRLKPYWSFAEKNLEPPDKRFPLLEIYKRAIGETRLGVACFNTAWRATGEADDVDRAHLLLGERNVDNAIEALSDCDISIAVMHHPLDWLADFDEFAVSSRLQSHFDLLLCGHTHRAIPQTRTTAQGTSLLSQTGSIYASRRWFNGYQLVRLSTAEAICKFLIRTYYDTPRRVFDAATNIIGGGEVNLKFDPHKKSEDDDIVEGFLRKTRKGIRDRASEHLNMIGIDLIGNVDIKDAFVIPPLSVKSLSGRSNESLVDQNEAYEEISLDDLLRSSDSYLIVGSREMGKTSLLHYLAVICAEGTCDVPRIPVIINAETLGANEYELRKAISIYYGSLPSPFDVRAALKAGLFLFLVDNLIPQSSGSAALAKQMTAYEGCRWICISRPRDGSITGDTEDPTENHSLRRVRLGALPRRSIRALSARWSPSIGGSNEDVFDAVMKQLKAAGLPRTAYMVTLILWAMQQEKELDRINEAMLLSNVADHLLGKADFRLSTRGKLDPRAKEITLEYLAEFVRDAGGYVPVDDAVSYLADLFANKRLKFVAVDVVNELIRCGILDRCESTVSFKYKCFEEYFFALRIKGDSELSARIIAPGVYPLYAREIEMLAGLRRQNKDIIAIIQSDMESRIPVRISEINLEEFSKVIESSVGFSLSKEQLSDLRKRRMSADQIDDLLDAADRRAIRDHNEQGISSNQEVSGTEVENDFVLTSAEPDVLSVADYVVASTLLAKVVKNSDFTDFDDKAPAARLVLRVGMQICALFRKEITEIMYEANIAKDGSEVLSGDEIEVLSFYFTKLISKIIAFSISSQLSSPNIAPMMDEIRGETGTSVLEQLFVVYLLQSLRYKGWEDRWSELLRQSGASGFIVESLIERIRGIVNTQFLDDKEYEKLHSVIDTAEEVLGWSARHKGQVIADLKKAALQADLRDTV